MVATMLLLAACGSLASATPTPEPTPSCPTQEERAYIVELRDHFVTVEAASTSAEAISGEGLAFLEWQSLYIEQMLRIIEAAIAIDVVEAPASMAYVEELVDDISETMLDYARLSMRGAANEDTAAMEAGNQRALELFPLMQAYGDALESHCEG